MNCNKLKKNQIETLKLTKALAFLSSCRTLISFCANEMKHTDKNGSGDLAIRL